MLWPARFSAVGGDAMPRSKKPDVPKFAPVIIEGLRPEIRSLANSPEDASAMYAEDMARIKSELGAALASRLEVLRKHLGVPEGNLFLLLIAIADKYVRDFEVQVGTVAKPGPRKKAERFKIVTAIEARAAAEQISIKEAIRSVALKPIESRQLSVDSLTTKYYGSLKEIEAHGAGRALLKFWRDQLPIDHSADMDVLFWPFERQYLNATKPHNVRQFPLKK